MAFWWRFTFFLRVNRVCMENGLFLQSFLKNGPMNFDFRETFQIVYFYRPEHIKTFNSHNRYRNRKVWQVLLWGIY